MLGDIVQGARDSILDAIGNTPVVRLRKLIGSTGSSLAFVCAVKGDPFRVVSSDAFAPEKFKTMRAFGADLVIVPNDRGGITPDLIPRLMAEAMRKILALIRSF